MVASLDLLIRAVLIHYPVKDALVDSKTAPQPKPLLDHSLITLSSPGQIAFRITDTHNPHPWATVGRRSSLGER